MPVNFNSPLAQAIIEEGRRRGYSDYAIASSLGNGAQESALNHATKPGDNGTAFGGFQWRHERFDGLKRLAAQRGTSYQDPKVQAAHWFNEQEGSESRWGLKNAKSLEEAVKAGISALRPAGWTPKNPTAGHGYQSRLQNAQSALQMLMSGGKGGSLPTQVAQAAPMEQALSGGSGDEELSGGAGGDTLATDAAPAAPQSMWDQFLSGGPGALFGAPQEDWNMGDALTGAGVAMMARDNPSGAAAMASALRYKKDGKTKDKKKSLVHGPNGSVHEYDQDTGTTREVIQGQEKEDLPKTGDSKYFGENYDAADKIARATDIFDKHRRRVAAGEVDLTVLDRIKQSATELVGTAMSPAQRNAVELALDLEDMRNAKLLEHKGVQTEGDAERAMKSIMPGIGKYNPDAVLTALDRGYSASQRMYGTAINKNDAIVKRWGDKIAHTGYGDWHKSNSDRWSKSEQEFAAQRENYYKNRQTQQQHTQETVTGRPQRTQTPQISEGRTATGPNGEKIIFRNGRWEPLK